MTARMTSSGLVVVGSGPAGLSAGETFRGYRDEAPVTILTADANLPYARPPLSKEYLRAESDDTFLHPAQWYADRRLDVVHVGAVTEVRPTEHVVVADGAEIPYQALVLACGATPHTLPVPDGHHAAVLRSLTDADRLRRACHSAQSAVVIGAGFHRM
jgi:NAD(P)H-nitrite reductase large subunit